jgi:predicted ATPase/transcriptional regulator with XRE-family HTH domain
METFGEWVRSQRSQLRLTRKQLADRVGCSVALLRKIENGERRPSEQIATLMANCLNIPTDKYSTFVKVARGELSVDHLSPNMTLVPTSKTPRTNLPILPTPLIGRQREVEHLSQLLCDPQCRLLTLVGMGGIGKTRLAIEAAAQVQDAFADGVYFVALASVNATRLLVPVIADAIGFAFQSAGDVDPKTQLFNYLKEKQVLLLLDNLEQLLAETGIEMLAELLTNATKVKLLATSRESLELQGEWTFEVHGLPIPERIYSEESVHNTSVELFLQRARQAHAGFSAATEDFPAVVYICELVEGMPLAIELAAAWVRALSCSEIAQEIESGLDFLSKSFRDLPARHRSMRAIFEHSWKLLTEEEQAILLRLSVFRGGFQREAAEQVAGATLSTLSNLITKSWVRHNSAKRYDLHELIRQFTAEYLAERPDEQIAIQARHGNYYLTFFSQADGHLRGSAQCETLDELTVEMDNFRVGWDWAVLHGEFLLIEQTLRTFAMLYDMRGWLQEGSDALDFAIHALETVHGQLPPGRTELIALGRLLATRSLLASRLGGYEQARAMLERSLEILRPLNEPQVLVEAITFTGMVMEMTGDYDRALEMYSEGLEIAKEIDDRWFAALCFTCQTGLTVFMHRTVEPELTYEHFQSAVADWRLIGDPRMTAIALNNFSLSAKILGHYDEACATLEESVILSMSVGDRWGLGFAYRGLGHIAQAKGQDLEAVNRFQESLEILTELGARQDQARVLAEMGWSVFVLGNDSEAGQVWRESLCIAIQTQGIFIALEDLVGLASLRARRGDLEYAVKLLLFVLDHPASIQGTKDRAARLLVEWEAQLTSKQVKAALAWAQAKNFDAVVDEVLMQLQST